MASLAPIKKAHIFEAMKKIEHEGRDPFGEPEDYQFRHNSNCYPAKAIVGHALSIATGRQYIECHHHNPLSERSENEWLNEVKTTIKDVDIVCSNCHRMLHRKRPALKVDYLKKQLQVLPGQTPGSFQDLSRGTVLCQNNL